MKEGSKDKAGARHQRWCVDKNAVALQEGQDHRLEHFSKASMRRSDANQA